MTAELYRRPAWVRQVNAMAPGVGGARNMVPLDADDLLARARRITGFDDIGRPLAEEAFQRLVNALDTEAELNVVGRLMSRHDALRHLCTRLLVIAETTRIPKILGEPIAAPLFITGPARSGTSILHDLLAQDPQLRAPLAYEMAYPTSTSSDRPDRRAEWAESEFDLWATVQPEFATVHNMSALLPEECLWLMAPDFDAVFWTTCTDIPSFVSWRMRQDTEHTYRFHQLMLQLLQHGHRQQRWVLKSPGHLSRLPALFATYPDALVIHTHRDPMRTVPSTVSTLAAGRWIRSDATDPQLIATAVGFGLRYALEAVIGLRESGAIPRDRIVDLHYRDLMRDPVATIEAAYDKLGLAFTDRFARRIDQYLQARPQHKFGVHTYHARDFGYDPAELRTQFKGYTTYYDIEEESE